MQRPPNKINELIAHANQTDEALESKTQRLREAEETIVDLKEAIKDLGDDAISKKEERLRYLKNRKLVIDRKEIAELEKKPIDSKIDWTPKLREIYYYIENNGDVLSHFWANDKVDKGLKEFLGVFNDEDTAMKESERIKKLIQV